MTKIAVIIPYFQRAPGILRRAVVSVVQQHLPPGVTVHIIVVDDGSPISAQAELAELDIAFPFSTTIIPQPNSGVAAARNRGLDEVSGPDTLIALLDSDDIWPPNHLAGAVRALQEGFDFSFTDNARSAHHESYIAECAPRTERVIAACPRRTRLVEIPGEQMAGLIVKEFPAQASTVVFKRSIAPSLRFNTRLRAAGEDLLFFAMLASTAGRVAFIRDSLVECGNGVNMYFGNFDWDSPKCMEIRVDQLVAHRMVSKVVMLSPASRQLSDEEVVRYRRELAFHTLRNLVKHPARALKQIARLFRLDPVAAIVLPGDMIRVALRLPSRSNDENHQQRQP